ncbi:MAG: hypothetical protein M5U12_21170 [Verrucomicrobia bacterium]|nr:hypothetical protein [Verrucomicrobiota bacterium]
MVALVMAGCSNNSWALETLALKDGAAITGRILAEKPEHYGWTWATRWFWCRKAR